MNFNDLMNSHRRGLKTTAEQFNQMAQYETYVNSKNLSRNIARQQSVSDTRNVLLNADVTKNYGPLQFALAEYTSMPRSGIGTAIQDHLAHSIHNEVQSYIDYRNRDGGDYGIKDVLNDPQAMKIIKSQPFRTGLDLMNTTSRGNELTLGEEFPELKGLPDENGEFGGLQYIGEAFDILSSAALPAIDQRVQDLLVNDLDFGGLTGGAADFIQGSYVKLPDIIFKYGFGDRTAGFTKYAAQSIFNVTTNMIRHDKNTFAPGFASEENIDDNADLDAGLGIGPVYYGHYTSDEEFFSQFENEQEPEVDPTVDDPLEKTMWDILRVDDAKQLRIPDNIPDGVTLSGAEPGDKLDFDSLTPDNVRAMMEQARAGEPITIPTEFGYATLQRKITPAPVIPDITRKASVPTAARIGAALPFDRDGNPISKLYNGPLVKPTVSLSSFPSIGESANEKTRGMAEGPRAYGVYEFDGGRGTNKIDERGLRKPSAVELLDDLYSSSERSYSNVPRNPTPKNILSIRGYRDQGSDEFTNPSKEDGIALEGVPSVSDASKSIGSVKEKILNRKTSLPKNKRSQSREAISEPVSKNMSSIRTQRSSVSPSSIFENAASQGQGLDPVDYGYTPAAERMVTALLTASNRDENSPRTGDISFVDGPVLGPDRKKPVDLSPLGQRYPETKQSKRTLTFEQRLAHRWKQKEELDYIELRRRALEGVETRTGIVSKPIYQSGISDVAYPPRPGSGETDQEREGWTQNEDGSWRRLPDQDFALDKGMPHVSPYYRMPAGDEALTHQVAVGADEFDDDIIGPTPSNAQSSDLTMAKRRKYDATHPVKEEKDDYQDQLEAASEGVQDSIPKRIYQAITSVIRGNGFPAAQAMRRGTTAGWISKKKEEWKQWKNGKPPSITPEELFDEETQARGKDDVSALTEGGSISIYDSTGKRAHELTDARNERNSELRAQARNTDASIEYTPQRHVGSDVGNLPNMPNTAGRSTPMPQRNRRDKVLGSIEGTSSMHLRDAVRRSDPTPGGSPFGPATNAYLDWSVAQSRTRRSDEFDLAKIGVIDSEISRALTENRTTSFAIAFGAGASQPDESENLRTAYFEERAAATGYALGPWSRDTHAGTKSARVSKITQSGNTPPTPPSNGPDDPYGDGPLGDPSYSATPPAARVVRPDGTLVPQGTPVITPSGAPINTGDPVSPDFGDGYEKTSYVNKHTLDYLYTGKSSGNVDKAGRQTTYFLDDDKGKKRKSFLFFTPNDDASANDAVGLINDMFGSRGDPSDRGVTVDPSNYVMSGEFRQYEHLRKPKPTAPVEEVLTPEQQIERTIARQDEMLAARAAAQAQARGSATPIPPLTPRRSAPKPSNVTPQPVRSVEQEIQDLVARPSTPEEVALQAEADVRRAEYRRLHPASPRIQTQSVARSDDITQQDNTVRDAASPPAIGDPTVRGGTPTINSFSNDSTVNSGNRNPTVQSGTVQSRTVPSAPPTPVSQPSGSPPELVDILNTSARVLEAMYPDSNHLNAHASVYNRSINPMQSAERAFRSLLDTNGEAKRWGYDNQTEFTARTSALFNQYADDRAIGHTGDNVVNQVPVDRRQAFSISAQRGIRAMVGTFEFNKMASQAGIERIFNNAQEEIASGSNPFGLMAGYSDTQYGQMLTSYDENGAQVPGGSVGKINKNGIANTKFTNKQVMEATDIAKMASAQAMSTSLPSEPAAAVATYNSRVDSIVSDRVKEISRSMSEQGIDKDKIQESVEYIQSSVRHITRAISDKMVGLLENAEGSGASAKDAGDIKAHAQKPADLADAQKILEDHPKIARQVEDYQRANKKSLQDMLDAPGSEANIFADEDVAIQIGGKGTSRDYDGSARGNGRMGEGGLFEGKFGAAMYAAYVGKRMWSMGMGETMQDAKTYGDYSSAVGGIVGAGQGVLGTSAGYAARQSIGQLYSGRAALQEFGAFTDIPFYMAASGNESGGRMWETTKAGATTAAEIAIGGTMLGQMAKPGSALAAVASKSPAAGLAIGAAMIASVGFMELWNSQNKDKPPLTMSSVLSNAVNEGWEQKAASEYYADNPDKSVLNSSPLGKFGGDWARGIGQALNIVSPTSMLLPSLSKLFEKPVAQEDLEKYLTPLKIGTMYPKRNEDVEASVRNAGYWATYGQNETQQQQAQAALYNATGRVPTPEMIDKFGVAVQRYGTSGITDAQQYAYNMGYAPGTEESYAAMSSFSSDYVSENIGIRNSMENAAGRYAQIGSQLNQYMAPGSRGVPAINAQKYGINTQQKAQVVQGFTQTVANYQNYAISDQQNELMSEIGSMSTPYQSQMINKLGNISGEAGYNPQGIMYQAGSANLSPQQWASIDTIMSGDLRGASFFANQGKLSGEWALYDKSGAGIHEVNGAKAMQVFKQWGSTGADWLTSGSGVGGTDRELAARFTGTDNAEILDAFMQGGTRDIEKLARSKSYESQMASAGLQLKQIAQQEKFLWGGAEGSWSNPTAGSSWGIQDQQRAQQYQFQLADFAQSEKSMNMSNRYAITREENQLSRMNTTQNYNTWQMDTTQSAALRQRGWTQQDYQYQDTNRELNYEWSSTDLNEEIRFSSGRDRKKLIRQRDRAALSYNLEGEQIETQRGRQTELWATEDERYKKQKEYTLELNTLDRQSFETNRQQREETYQVEIQNLARKRSELDQSRELEAQAITLERENQYISIQFQKEAAAIQMGAAATQKLLNETLITTAQNSEKIFNPIKEMLQYDSAFKNAEAMKAMFQQVNGIVTAQPGSVTYMLSELNSITETKVNAVTQFIQALKYMVP